MVVYQFLRKEARPVAVYWTKIIKKFLEIAVLAQHKHDDIDEWNNFRPPKVKSF